MTQRGITGGTCQCQRGLHSRDSINLSSGRGCASWSDCWPESRDTGPPRGMPDLEALNHGKPIASASARSSDSFSHGIPQRVAGYLAVLVVIAFGITACTTQLQIGPLSWTTAMPCARRAAGQCPPCQQPQAAAAPVPPVLAHVLMMTAFHWDTTHLSFLTQARLMLRECRLLRQSRSAGPLTMNPLGARGQFCVQNGLQGWLYEVSRFFCRGGCTHAQLMPSDSSAVPVVLPVELALHIAGKGLTRSLCSAAGDQQRCVLPDDDGLRHQHERAGEAGELAPDQHAGGARVPGARRHEYDRPLRSDVVSQGRCGGLPRQGCAARWKLARAIAAPASKPLP